MTDTAEPTTTCPRGHLVRLADVASRDGMLVCPVCDRPGPQVADELWRRPGPTPSPSAAPLPAPPAPAPAAWTLAGGQAAAAFAGAPQEQASGDAVFARPGSTAVPPAAAMSPLAGGLGTSPAAPAPAAEPLAAPAAESPIAPVVVPPAGGSPFARAAGQTPVPPATLTAPAAIADTTSSGPLEVAVPITDWPPDQHPAPAEAPAAAAPPRAAIGRGWAGALRIPVALLAVSVVVTLASSFFFVAEAIELSDAGDVGASARVVGTILAATGNLVLVIAVVWVVWLLIRRARD